MSGTGRDHADDLLSAHLDGELGPDEAAWVTDHLRSCPECQEASAALVATRELLRSLPGFDASPVVDGILARHRTVIRAGMAFVGVASIVLGVLALTAAVQTPIVEPDVGAMSDAHEKAEQEHLRGLRTVDDARGMYVAPPGLASSAGTLTRTAVFDGPDLTIVIYEEGDQIVSMYEQPGVLDWSSLPDGVIATVSGRKVWISRGSPAVAVTELGHLVVSVVADHADMARAAVADLPDRRRESVWDRVHDACQRFTEVFALSA